jgi:hypothetical protein
MKKLLALLLFALPAMAQTPVPVTNGSFELPATTTYTETAPTGWIAGGNFSVGVKNVGTTAPDGVNAAWINPGGSLIKDLGTQAAGNYVLTFLVSKNGATSLTVTFGGCSQIFTAFTFGKYITETLACTLAASGDLSITLANTGTSGQPLIDSVAVTFTPLGNAPPVTLSFAPSTSALMPCTDVVSYDDGTPLFPSPQTFTIMEQEGSAQVSIGTPTIGINGQVTGTVTVNPNFMTSGQVLLFATIGGIAGLPQIQAQPFDPRQLQQGSTGICLGIVLFKSITLPKYSVLGLTP